MQDAKSAVLNKPKIKYNPIYVKGTLVWLIKFALMKTDLQKFAYGIHSCSTLNEKTCRNKLWQWGHHDVLTHLIRGKSISRKLLNRKRDEWKVYFHFSAHWSRSRIKVCNAVHVYLLGKEFQASYHGHRIDMILIVKSNFMRPYWPKQCS